MRKWRKRWTKVGFTLGDELRSGRPRRFSPWRLSVGTWKPISQVAQGSKGAVYHAQSFTDSLEGRPYRFIVVHSYALDQRKVKSIDKQIKGERDGLIKAQKQLPKQTFKSRPNRSCVDLQNDCVMVPFPNHYAV